MIKLRTIAILFSCAILMASSTSDQIDREHLDTAKLESMVLSRINKIRASKGLQELDAHQALKKASEDQVKYITVKGQLLHTQSNPQKAKARDRVEFYGGKMRGVGENVAYIKLFIPAIYKGDQGKLDTLNIKNYQQAADYLVYSWMNSSAHRANILYADYEFTGLSVKFKPSTNTLYAVQVFGLDYE